MARTKPHSGIFLCHLCTLGQWVIHGDSRAALTHVLIPREGHAKVTRLTRPQKLQSAFAEERAGWDLNDSWNPRETQIKSRTVISPERLDCAHEVRGQKPGESGRQWTEPIGFLSQVHKQDSHLCPKASSRCCSTCRKPASYTDIKLYKPLLEV